MSAFEKTMFTDHGNIRVLHAPTELDVYTAPKLREASVEAVNNGFYRMVVDLSNTTDIDVTGLGVLVGVHKRAERYGGWLRLTKPAAGSAAERALRIAGLARVFVIENDVEAAIAAEEVNVQ